MAELSAGAVRIEPFGDAAMLVRVGTGIDDETLARSHAVAAAIERLRAEVVGLRRPVPAYDSVLVPFDPEALDLDAAHAAVSAVTAVVDPAADPADPQSIEIRVRYGGADGPDLEAVAEHAGVRPVDVVALHADARYRVAFLGFAPGFAYLRPVPVPIRVPRRATPHERVPAGSVAIAGEQTAVYPFAMPGGWSVIGRTEAILFEPGRRPPTPFFPGATVRFVPVGERR